MDVRISKEILVKITDILQERNIYVHPNLLARDIFWQRLERIGHFLKKYAKHEDKVLDFGGGSGAFSVALSRLFSSIDIIDLDCSDAMKIIDYFGITNVHLINGDIRHAKIEQTYDVIIAADVLEHFKDLNVPLAFFKKNMSKTGLLFISVPTENWLYCLGRLIVNKKKPIDHYHSSRDVIDFLKRNGFQVIRRDFMPRYLATIPLFDICVLQHQAN